ncbi:MAG: DUF4397 domain-containing protein [Rubrivivax sp.]|nr:DUF4397 domain-containing protein [Rubrivivax sp.]
MTFRWMAALAALLLTLLAGCGGGTDRTKAQVRLVNASTGYAALDLRVDDEARQSGVAYGGNAAFVEAKPGKVFTLYSPGAATSLLSFTPGVSADKYYSVLAYGRAGALKQVLLDENNAQPDTNRTYVRVVNAAPAVGALDVYITAAGDSLDASVAVQAAAAVDAVGSFITINSGTWRVRATVPGSTAAADVRLDVSGISFGSKEVVTLVLVPGPSGVLAKALLLRQQGGIDVLAATQARVRVATGITDMAVTLGGSPLLVASGLPVVTSYAALVSGSPTLAVTVGGTAVSTTNPTLVPGTDYTLLVHGTAAAPLFKWLTDDNAPLSDTTKAKLRLVNGSSGFSGSLSMTIDGAPLSETVATGEASGYVTQAATTTADIAVAATSTLYTATDRTFTAGGVYSVFLLGASGSTTGVFRQDR